MKRFLFIVAVVVALVLTYSGAEALVIQVTAADGLKSSVITFVLTLGFALLGPALLAAAVFFHRRSDSRPAAQKPVPATPKQIHRPYLHGH
jgi:TRAP-type C4-dicarboxylate transport system permease small subunit